MTRSLDDVVRILRHAGLHDIADEAARRLNDPVDQLDLEKFLQPYGVTKDALISRMGGSP